VIALTREGVTAFQLFPHFSKLPPVYNMQSMMLMQQLYSDYLDRWLKGR
jgi:hypothetical protein